MSGRITTWALALSVVVLTMAVPAQEQTEAQRRAARVLELYGEIADLADKINDLRNELARRERTIAARRREHQELGDRLEQARQQANDARRGMSEAQIRHNQAQRQADLGKRNLGLVLMRVGQELEKAPDFQAVQSRHQAAVEARDRAKQAVLDHLDEGPEYRAAADELARVKSVLAELDRRPEAVPDQRMVLALEALRQDAEVAALRRAALEADAPYQQADQSLSQALAELSRARQELEKKVGQHPDAVAAQQTLLQAHEELVAAREALAQAAHRLSQATAGATRLESEYALSERPLQGLLDRQDEDLRRVATLERQKAGKERDLEALR